jgi:RNA polymerase sigma-70 factor (ECF subfamily)
VIYCVIPADLAAKLHDPLRRHFRDDPRVEVVVERRRVERRLHAERRGAEAESRAEEADERRRVRNSAGRRIGDRRAALAEVEVPPLPWRARAHAERIVFVERAEPSAEHDEDLDTARLVTRIQGGDRESFGELYMRYFDRVYGYLRVAVRDRHEAEDLTQQVFVNALEALPRYERRGTIPFRIWLFTIVRRSAIDAIAARQRMEPTEPEQLTRALESEPAEPELRALSWLTDRELVMLVERLPLAQRQVLMLRYMLDLPHAEIARILDRSPDDVRILAHRALRFLEKRLRTLGHTPTIARLERARACPKQAWVLRHRRFALR